MDGWASCFLFIKIWQKKQSNIYIYIYKPWDFLLGISAKKTTHALCKPPHERNDISTHLQYLAVAFPEPRQSFGARSVRNEEIHEEIARDSVDFPTIHGWNCGASFAGKTHKQFVSPKWWNEKNNFWSIHSVNFCFTNSIAFWSGKKLYVQKTMTTLMRFLLKRSCDVFFFRMLWAGLMAAKFAATIFGGCQCVIMLSLATLWGPSALWHVALFGCIAFWDLRMHLKHDAATSLLQWHFQQSPQPKRQERLRKIRNTCRSSGLCKPSTVHDMLLSFRTDRTDFEHHATNTNNKKYQKIHL